MGGRLGIGHDYLSCAYLTNTDNTYNLYYDPNDTNSHSLVRNIVPVLEHR